MGRCRPCRQRPNGEASSTRDSHPEKIARSLREAGGQAEVQRGPAPLRACSGGSERSKDWLGTQKQGCGSAGLDGSDQGQESSSGPLPHHPAWSLAVNTKRTSSVSREIFISGGVGSVCWPLRVLPAGWPGAGGEGAWHLLGAICGAPEGRAGRACAEAPAWSQNLNACLGERRELTGEKLGFLQIPQHNLLLFHVPVFILVGPPLLASCIQALAPVWCPDL